MSNKVTICAGTIGKGLKRSSDGGANWGQVGGDLTRESSIQSLAVHPREPKVLYAGAEDGIHRSVDQGRTFHRLASPMNSLEVWSIAIDPQDPDTIFAGTRPAALFRSRDGGQHWQQLPVDVVEKCPAVNIPRVTALMVDPTDHRVVWAGIEVDGVRRSLDGGDTWTRIYGPADPDIHGLKISTADPKATIAVTHGEVYATTDMAENWQGLGIADYLSASMPAQPTPFYTHGLAVKEKDPSVLFVGVGNAPTGDTGYIVRSLDRGRTWQKVEMSAEANTTIFSFATNPEDPDLILACSRYGQIFASHDGGDTWVKLRREFTEVKTLVWVPNS